MEYGDVNIEQMFGLVFYKERGEGLQRDIQMHKSKIKLTTAW